MNRKYIKRQVIISTTIVMLVMMACNNKPKNLYSDVEQYANIYPAYESTVIPRNIAPFNFMIREESSRFIVRFAIAGKDSFDISGKGKVQIPLQKWKRLLNKYPDEQLNVSIFAKKSSGWTRYKPLQFTIAEDVIDPYLAYRLIEPGYENWGKMGIYQRHLESFNETPIMVNNLNDWSCVNCHSFNNGDPETMLFHVRRYNAGTILVKDGNVSKINTGAPGMLSAGVYPRWHREGRYVAFSTNTTRQVFHSIHTNKVEVFDEASNIVIYDTETNTIFTDRLIHSEQSFETFPEWSPDGRYLYFCSAEARQMPNEYDSLRYDLLRIEFNAATGTFGNKVDTLVSSVVTGKSVAHARVSPDSKYVVFCLSDYGTFPIWHREADLYLLNLETNEIRNMVEINSDQSETYHSWSTNGRWLVFGSRRMDGTFTRPYICYFDTDGNAHKPFLLPQKDPLFYDFSMKSFNIPEFIIGKVEISPYEFAKAAKGKAIDTRLK